MTFSRGNKFKAVRVNGFDSRKEARRFRELELLQAAGEIRDLIAKPRYALVVNGTHCGYYTPDARFLEHGRVVVEEVKGGTGTRKGTRTEAYQLRVKVFKACYPQIEHREI